MDSSFIFKVLNFAVLAVALVMLARKHLPVLLQKRQDEVAQAIEKAKAKEAEAHHLLQEYDQKLSELGVLIEQTLHAARKHAELERETILAQANKEAAEIKQSAERSVKNLRERLHKELQRETTLQALRLAEAKANQIFSGTAGKSKEQGLVQQFIDEVSRYEGR